MKLSTPQTTVQPMKLAIASGKGGTGKTTLAVALAQACLGPVHLLDCDVEEPNTHLFLTPHFGKKQAVTVAVPQINESLCNHCGQCADFCQFNAIVALPKQTMIFSELCHSCGGCVQICPTSALTETDKKVGTIERGQCDHITLVKGTMDVGQAMSPPVIRAVKKQFDPNYLTIVDCPPGTSCPMITAVRDADFVLLVTEPTPFGLHDLTLAVETLRQLKLPFGVVLNRSDIGDQGVVNYCRQEPIPIMLQIPDDRKVAVAYSRGKGLLDALPDLKPQLQRLLNTISQRQHGGQR